MSVMECSEIMKLLPHRFPMLMVDRVVELDSEKRIVAIKNISADEPCFQGHFPGFPIFPGVLQLEAMAQTGGILITKRAGGQRRIPLFMSIDNAKFRKMIVPGDQMRIEVEFSVIRAKVARFHGRILVDGALASEADLMCMITDQEPPA